MRAGSVFSIRSFCLANLTPASNSRRKAATSSDSCCRCCPSVVGFAASNSTVRGWNSTNCTRRSLLGPRGSRLCIGLQSGAFMTKDLQHRNKFKKVVFNEQTDDDGKSTAHNEADFKRWWILISIFQINIASIGVERI